MQVVFVSNYINHHQIPFCNAMFRMLEGSFAFIQTIPMEDDRRRMGWKEESLPYLVKSYEETARSKDLIATANVVLFGGCEEEAYIHRRLQDRKPVIRISERLYREGQWKMITPRGLRKKFIDHTRYRSDSVYLLCTGAYVPSDFHLVRAYPDKMFRWGYFPPMRTYSEEYFKTREANTIPQILWAARFIGLKHPEVPILCAKYLRDRGLHFHMKMIGGGELEPSIRRLIAQHNLESTVSLLGYQEPLAVRDEMERTDIYLCTSNHEEGWGAVINEAMNSGCAVVANYQTGAAPYLIRHGENGFVYKDAGPGDLFRIVENLLLNVSLRSTVGKEAYRTITQKWNADYAAACLLERMITLGLLPKETLTGALLSLKEEALSGALSAIHDDALSDALTFGKDENARASLIKDDGPCAVAPIIAPGKMYQACIRRQL
ncbi:MAG: glycosyltransferase [Clostridium sp.]|jgi:glycosyltransferase involved in cell wall biosynthesis|nr:glycosyltransferase [Clostridium sp.]